GRTVAVLYDLTAFKMPSGGKGLSRTLSDWRWQAYARKLKATDHVIAVSGSAKNDAVSMLGMPPGMITVVHPGLDHGRFKLGSETKPRDEHPPYFLHLGGFNENKNQVRVLEAFAAVAAQRSDIEMHFSGPWHESSIAW